MVAHERSRRAALREAGTNLKGVFSFQVPVSVFGPVFFSISICAYQTSTAFKGAYTFTCT